MSAELVGLPEAITAITKEIDGMHKKARAAVVKAGHAYQHDVQVLAPVDIGQYKASIRVEEPSFIEDLGSGEGPYVYIGTDKPQACRLEFGFWGMRDVLGRLFYQYPRPHFRPPMDTQMDKYLQIMEGTFDSSEWESYTVIKKAEWQAMETGFPAISGSMRGDFGGYE